MGTLKMGKNCSVCKEWQEHCYWSHMADDSKHFLKHMAGDFTESMTVPARFADNFNGHISEEVNLRPPSGKTWSIGVASSGAGEVVLQSGWKEFVDGNSVQEGDCLLFRYSGVSSFDVLIFDPSGCEKASPHFAESHGGAGRAEKYAGAGGGGRNNADIGHHHHLEMTLHRNSGRSVPRACKRCLFSDDTDQDECEAKEDDDDEDVVKGVVEGGYYFGRNGRVGEYNLREEDKEEISRFPVPLHPGNPVFVHVIHAAHIRTSRYSILGMSPEFAGKYLGALKEVVLERASRRAQWRVMFVHRHNTRGFYGVGWRQFAGDNGLAAHDVCLFELMTADEAGSRRRRRPTMTVHVLRRVRGCFVLLR